MRTDIRSRASRSGATMIALVAALGVALAVRPAAAQVVGRLPGESVLQDLTDGQRFGVFGGYLVTGRDPVGVRAHSSPIYGVRYDVLMGSPGYFTMRLFGTNSQHDVFDPNAPVASRRVGTAQANQMGFDAGFNIALTGDRTWHHFQPLVNAGIGFIAGVGNSFDKGQYQPGGSVLYSYGLALRYNTGKNADLRLDASWLIYQVRYPDGFRTTTAADNQPLRPDGSLTPYTTNRALTLAWTWGIFR